MAIVDFHNHLIPGVDDGAQTPAESVAGVAAFIENGVGVLVATPHFDAGLSLDPPALAARLTEIDAGWDALRAMCTERYPELETYRAVELLLDIPEPDLGDARLRMNGGPFFLVEFPFMTVPPHSARALSTLRQTGYIPILAHPERYRGLPEIEVAGAWREAGAYLQVNGGSLLGRYGTRAQHTAHELLRRSWVDYVCSDYHARGVPLISEYRKWLEQAAGLEQAVTLTETNPARMLRGDLPLPLPLLRSERRSIWQRMGGLFR